MNLLPIKKILIDGDNPTEKELSFSIVIVSFNTLIETSRCIQSVLRWTPNAEIIVVDNASKDGSQAYLLDCAKRLENFKVIINEENRNFGPAQNQGFAIAEGRYIVALNSDCVVTEAWADRMASIFNLEPNTAIVGPVTNSSNGRQQIAGDTVGLNVDQIAQKVCQQESGRYAEAGILYGWCMMFSRDFLNSEEYVFDERFTNSYEDNDVCLRARLRGLKLFIDCSTFIYHDGQASFKKHLDKDFIKKYIENGNINQKLFFQKYQDNKKKKLIAVYRIANCEQYVAKSLEQTSKFADEIICLFARSQDKTKEIALSFPKVVKWEEWNEPEHPFDEQAERNWLLQEAIARGADWVISIDGDEIYENKFIDMVPGLLNPKNPQVMGYWCNWRTIWENGEDGEKFRADGIFGGFQNYRFFRVLPGMEIKENDNLYNHHCGSAPSIPMENLKWLNVRVKHLGYDSEEQRKRKHAFYKKADPRPLAKDVGNSDYHHLVDKNVILKPYRENNRLSVMTICKNEEETIFDMLNVVEPVADEYVIIDTGSTDGTLQEIERFKITSHKEVRIIDASQMFARDEKGMLMNYSEAKNFGKSQCKYEWILNMDCDELFSWSQVTNIFGLLEEEIDGFLFPVINYLEPPKGGKLEDNVYGFSETIRLYRNIDEIFYSGLIHESLEDSTAVRHKNGKGSLLMSPIPIHHRGYLKSREKVREKIDRYDVINRNQFEVSGGQDPRPLMNMALHAFNEGRQDEGMQLYAASLAICPEFWRSRLNMAYHHIDTGKKLLQMALSQMPEYMRRNNKAVEIGDFLAKFCLEQSRIG